jgi:hypothetical protein
MLLSVRHVTTYRYKRAVSFGEHRMMFRPRDSYDQKLLEARLQVTPEPSSIRWVHDVSGNCVTIAEFSRVEAKELRFESNIWLDHSPSNTPDFQIEDYAKTYPFTYSPEEIPDLAPMIVRQYPDADETVDRWARRFLRAGRHTDTGMLLMTLTYAFKESFTYERRSSRTRPPALTLKLAEAAPRSGAVDDRSAAPFASPPARLGLPHVPSCDGRAIAAVMPVRGLSARAGWVEFDHQCDRGTRSDPRGRGPRSEPGHTAVGSYFGAAGFRDLARGAPETAACDAQAGDRRPGVTAGPTRRAQFRRENRMKICAGYEIAYECPQPTPMVLM